MNLTQKKQDGGLKLVNVFKAKGTLTMHKICINKNHCSKTLHLLVEVNNHLVEGLIDTWTSMFIMTTIVVRDLGIM